MPFSRINMTSKEYVAFLGTNPFLGFHAKTYSAMGKLTTQLYNAYMQKTSMLPKVMTLREFAPLTHFYQTSMETYFDVSL
jgi:hypothetical protein